MIESVKRAWETQLQPRNVHLQESILLRRYKVGETFQLLQLYHCSYVHVVLSLCKIALSCT